MQRAKVRSNTDSRPSRFSPTRNSLPAWYVVKARLQPLRASQAGKLRELLRAKASGGGAAGGPSARVMSPTLR